MSEPSEVNILNEGFTPQDYTSQAPDEKVTVVQGTATSSSDITDGTAGQTATVTVTDSAGYVLPSTGGIGTVPFYVIGGILAIGAVIALVVRAKMKDR